MSTKNKQNRIFFEPRWEIRPDMALVETFQDGSQLIRKNGYSIIVDAASPCLSRYKMQANLLLFSKN